MTRTLLCLLAAMAVFGTGPGFAAPLPDKTGTPEKCISLRKKLNDREVVINACDICQVVRVERQRPGGALPDFRTVVVQGKAYVELPFRGPGYTRFVGADPCK